MIPGMEKIRRHAGFYPHGVSSDLLKLVPVGEENALSGLLLWKQLKLCLRPRYDLVEADRAAKIHDILRHCRCDSGWGVLPRSIIDCEGRSPFHAMLGFQFCLDRVRPRPYSQ